MIQRQNEMTRAALTTKAHRQPPAPRALTEFDHARLAEAERKRARKAAKRSAESLSAQLEKKEA